MNATSKNPGHAHEDAAHTAEDPAHLERLRVLVENAIADGKLTFEEMAEIRDALMADGKLTLEEMELVRDVMRQKLGDAPLEFERPSF